MPAHERVADARRGEGGPAVSYKGRVENTVNQRNRRRTNVYPPALQAGEDNRLLLSSTGMREVDSSVAVLNTRRALLARATDAALVTGVTCSCTVGTVCHVNVCTATLGTRETGTASSRHHHPSRRDGRGNPASSTVFVSTTLPEFPLRSFPASPKLQKVNMQLLWFKKQDGLKKKNKQRSVLRRKVLLSLLRAHTEKPCWYTALR